VFFNILRHFTAPTHTYSLIYAFNAYVFLIELTYACFEKLGTTFVCGGEWLKTKIFSSFSNTNYFFSVKYRHVLNTLDPSVLVYGLTSNPYTRRRNLRCAYDCFLLLQYGLRTTVFLTGQPRVPSKRRVVAGVSQVTRGSSWFLSVPLTAVIISTYS